MITQCNGYFLDENSGEFVAEGGRKVRFHNARFYDAESKTLIKATLDDDNPRQLPEPMSLCKLGFEVRAGERFCRLVYAGFKA